MGSYVRVGFTGVGEPLRLARRAWTVAEPVPDLPHRCAVLVASSAADSLVVVPTAGQLWGLWLPRSLEAKIHIATAAPERLGRQMTRTRRPEVVAHRRQLAECDRSVVAGVAVSSLAMTWRDLATHLGLPDLVAAGDSALRAGATIDELAEVVARTGGRSGARRARTALPMLDRRSRSRPESHVRVAIWTPDLPRFEVNEHVYRSEGGWLAEPDLSLVAAKIALEYQGADHAEVERLRRDITRATDLRRDGWLVLEYGPAQVFGRPDLITVDVRAAVLDRAPHLIRPPRARFTPRVVS